MMASCQCEVNVSVHYPRAEPFETSSGGTLHWETAVAGILATFKDCLLLDNFGNTQWIDCRYVGIILRYHASRYWKGGNRVAKAQSKQWWIRVSLWTKWQKATVHSCQLQWFQLWFTSCWMAPSQSDPQITPSLEDQCEALGNANWFYWPQFRARRALYSTIDVPVHPGAVWIIGRGSGIIYT